MKRYDTTYRVLETALKNLGWNRDEIAATLTEEFIVRVAGAEKPQLVKIVTELNEQRLRKLENDDDAPLVQKNCDFRCTNVECNFEMRNEIVDVPQGYPLSRLTMECRKCGADAKWFIPPGTRLAMQGEENVPREQLEAARLAAVRGAGGRIEPFRGETRSELKKWETENNLSSMSSDEASRGHATINSRTKFTETVEFEQELAANVDRAVQIAEAGGDRLAEAREQLGKLNDYDVDKFREQATAGVVDGEVPIAEGAVPVADIAEELTAVQRANQSRDHIAPERA